MECGSIQKIIDEMMKTSIAMLQETPIIKCFEYRHPETIPNPSIIGNWSNWWRGMVSENHWFK